MSVDPYEDKDVSLENPEIVKQMMERVAAISSNFGPNCNWFLADHNIEFESVSYIDELTGENITKQYHAPFVADEDYDSYVPALVDVNDIRRYFCMAIAVGEFLLVVWGVAKGTALMRRCF